MRYVLSHKEQITNFKRFVRRLYIDYHWVVCFSASTHGGVTRTTSEHASDVENMQHMLGSSAGSSVYPLRTPLLLAMLESVVAQHAQTMSRLPSPHHRGCKHRPHLCLHRSRIINNRQQQHPTTPCRPSTSTHIIATHCIKTIWRLPFKNFRRGVPGTSSDCP